MKSVIYLHEYYNYLHLHIIFFNIYIKNIFTFTLYIYSISLVFLCIFCEQELVAHGISNVVSANFNCYVTCVSLSRTAVLDSIGCKSQVYALWSCLLILIVIYFIAPLFAPLPYVSNRNFSFHLLIFFFAPLSYGSKCKF